MKIGPKYKIARRVGAPIFEKTQTQKYALRAERKAKNKKFGKAKSEFGLQLNEKQKARFIYGLTEKQFSNYVKKAIAQKTTHTAETIFQYLELRLDNIVYRTGLASTRRGARQIVSHGHITVGGKKVNIASYSVKLGDIIAIRDGSTSKTLFTAIEERLRTTTVPNWMTFDKEKKIAVITGMPQYSKLDTMFDLNSVIEYYSRS